jgi:alcohol dehydrogenase
MGTFHPRWFGGEMPASIQTDSSGAESNGWLCELKAVSQEAVVRLPGNWSYEEGSTLPCAGVTAWTALTSPVPIRAGLMEVSSAVTAIGLKPIIDRIFVFDQAKKLSTTSRVAHILDKSLSA